MKEKLGTKFVDTVGSKVYLYTLISTPDRSLFNLLSNCNRLLFFHSIDESEMEKYLKNLKQVSLD